MNFIGGHFDGGGGGPDWLKELILWLGLWIPLGVGFFAVIVLPILSWIGSL